MEKNEIYKKANELLAEIEELTYILKEEEGLFEYELRQLKERFEDPVGETREELKSKNGELIALMKKNKSELFGKRDKVKLSHGVLLYGEKDHVQIPRDALEKLQGLKWDDGINWTPSLNRPVIEKWPMERLAAIGAERKKKKSYSWELIQAKEKK